MYLDGKSQRLRVNKKRVPRAESTDHNQLTPTEMRNPFSSL